MSLENFLEVTFLTFFPLALAKAGVGGYIHSNTRNDFSISLISRDPGHRSGSVALHRNLLSISSGGRGGHLGLVLQAVSLENFPISMGVS